MLYILISLYAIYTLFELVLHGLEFRFVKQRKDSQNVILDADEFKSAAAVTLEKLKFKIFSLIYSFFVLLFWLFLGLNFLKIIFESDGQSSQIALFTCFLLINAIIALPLDIYEKFVLDKKLGFSTITAKIFIIDNIKSLIMLAVFGALGAMIFAFCYTYFSLWWLWAFAICFSIILLVNLIYPTIIAPLFNKMTPLDDGELKSSILSLLEACGFKSSGVFVMDASKRDNRLNAYFGGLGATKRVVLFDTLINKLSKDEIIAVLGHELGHFKHKDLVKNIIFMSVMLFIFFAILGVLNYEFYGILALGDTPIALLIFFLLFAPILSAFFMPLLSALSRRAEFGADSFGAGQTSAKMMISALKKLGSENKAFPLSHPLFSLVYHSHPSLFERITALEK